MFVKLDTYRINTDKITDYYHLNKYLYITLLNDREIELHDPYRDLINYLDGILLGG